MSRGIVSYFKGALGYTVSWLSTSKIGLYGCVIGTLGMVVVVVIAVVLVVGCGL